MECDKTVIVYLLWRTCDKSSYPVKIRQLAVALTSGKSSYLGRKWLRFSSVLTAADKQKYAKNKITWQLDQTNISITHTHTKTTQRTNFGSLESSCLLTKSGQLIPTLLFGASLFLAWLPSQINWFPVANLECSLCATFFPPFSTHIYRPSSPRGINQRQHCQLLRSCVCVSLFILGNGLFLFQFH